jgi:hypothetical protein
MNQQLVYCFQKWISLGIIIYPLPPNNLKVRASESLLTQKLHDEIQLLKNDILQWFEWLQTLHEELEERAAIMEFDGKYSREEAEHWAKHEILQQYPQLAEPMVWEQFCTMREMYDR